MTETATAEKKDVVPSAYRDKYKETGGTCGDFIATKLQTVAKDGSLDTIKAENGIEATRWAAMNPGMQRMNLANVLRGKFLNGETIKILGKEYNAKHQAEDFNGTVANDPKTLSRLCGFFELQDNERTHKALVKLFFPPAPKGPTADQKALTKATAAVAKLQTAYDKAKAAVDKASTASTEATGKLDTAKAAAKAADADGKAAADKAVTAAEKKAKAATEKHAAASKKFSEANAALNAANAEVLKLTPATEAKA